MIVHQDVSLILNPLKIASVGQANMFISSPQQDRPVYTFLAVRILVKKRGKMQDEIWPIQPVRHCDDSMARFFES